LHVRKHRVLYTTGCEKQACKALKGVSPLQALTATLPYYKNSQSGTARFASVPNPETRTYHTTYPLRADYAFPFTVDLRSGNEGKIGQCCSAHR